MATGTAAVYTDRHGSSVLLPHIGTVEILHTLEKLQTQVQLLYKIPYECPIIAKEIQNINDSVEAFVLELNSRE